MADKWFCGVEGQQYGPYTWDQMRAMAVEGRLIADSYVRREIDDQWFVAGKVPGLLSPAASAPAASSTAVQPATSLLASVPQKTPSAGTKLKRARPLEPANVPPIAEPPVAITAPPVSVPVGLPVGSAIPMVSFVAAPASVASANPPQPAIATNEERRPLLLVGVLCGACALVAVVAIGLITWSYSRSKDKNTETVADVPAATSAENPVAASGAEANPGDVEANPAGALAIASVSPHSEASGLKESATATVAATAASVESPLPAATASQAAAAKVIASLPKWTNVTQLRGIELNKLKLQVASVWLAADEVGTRVEPLPASDKNNAVKARFVFVEMRISNSAPVARKYKSWNVAPSEAAILAEKAEKPLALIPVAATPGITRLGIVDVQPNQSVTDVLVFAAPSSPIESLRLALAKTALAEHVKLPSHFALEIPLEVLMRAPGGNSNGAALAGTIADVDAAQTAAVIAPPVAADKPEGEAKPATAPEVEKPKGPPSIAELNKQFEELAKKEAAEKQKAAAPEKPPGK